MTALLTQAVFGGWTIVRAAPHASRALACGYGLNEPKHVIEALAVIYENDAEARKEILPTLMERLAYHQFHSQPTMDAFHKWLQRQSNDRLVQPNSGLGQAITYMLNRWDRLTLFLRKAGAPLYNISWNGP